MTWFYFSFADESGWLGGLYVEGNDISDALSESWRLGENPGGEIMFAEVDEEELKRRVPEADLGRLLSREEMEALGKTVRVRPGEQPDGTYAIDRAENQEEGGSTN